MIRQTALRRCQQLGLYIFLGLLAYMPFHILISTVIGVKIGGFELLKVLKDIVLVIGFGITTLALIGEKKLHLIIKDKLIWLIVAYSVLTVSLTFFRNPELLAEVIGVVYDLRFFMFVIYAMMLTTLYDRARLQATAAKIVAYCGMIVASFGVIQYFFLPESFFRALGYSKANGVLPAFYIDDKPNLPRIMSTVRDPNSLGSYLIIISSLLAGLLTKAKKFAHGKRYIFGLIVSVAAIFLTFSRSAFLGLVTAMVVFAGLYISTRFGVLNWLGKHKKVLLIIPVIVVVLGLGYIHSKNTYFFKNTVFHADQSTVIADPNQLRVMFWKQAIKDIIHNPLGYGPGSTGFASIKNQKQKVVFTEDYYLQVGREVGVLGLTLFIAIELVATLRLIKIYNHSHDVIVLALIASFAGLAVSNAFAHIWFNEAVAYTWWGLAGLYLFGKTKAKVS